MNDGIYTAPDAGSTAQNFIGEIFRLERREIRDRVDWLFYIDDCAPVILTTRQIMSSDAMLKKCFVEREKWIGYRSRRDHREWMQSLLDEMLARGA